MLAEGEEADLAGFEDSADAHGDGFVRDVFFAEEVAGGVLAGYGVEVDLAVRQSRLQPGSLKPMCPERPMPRIWTSIPPAAAMARS